MPARTFKSKAIKRYKQCLLLSISSAVAVIAMVKFMPDNIFVRWLTWGNYMSYCGNAVMAALWYKLGSQCQPER